MQDNGKYTEADIHCYIKTKIYSVISVIQRHTTLYQDIQIIVPRHTHVLQRHTILYQYIQCYTKTELYRLTALYQGTHYTKAYRDINGIQHYTKAYSVTRNE